MKTWFTVAEGSAYAGVSRDTIYTACERGELRHARIGGRRSIRLKPDWIDAWLEQHARGTIVRERAGRFRPWSRPHDRLNHHLLRTALFVHSAGSRAARGRSGIV